jgi:hypothetical protein
MAASAEHSPPIIHALDHVVIAVRDLESADLHVGYFANRYGEQWMFTFDRATGVASLHGRDVDWRTVHVVRDGRVDGLILNLEEAAWLQACWSAVSASP